MSAGISVRPLLPPMPNPPPSTGYEGELPPNEPSGLLMSLMLGLIVTLIVIAVALGCPVHGQQLVPIPDARFAATAEAVSDIRVSSVFGDSFPALQPGQIFIQRHIYVAAIDVEARQPAWVAFRVSRSDWDTDNVLSRNFHTPKALQPFALEESDYRASGYELGHLYGLQFVSASTHAAEVNEVSVIAAQRPALNKGPWLEAESAIRKASEQHSVSVIAGLLWLEKMPPLAHADESHRVASHCWMIFSPGLDGREEAYLFRQDCLINQSMKTFAIDAGHLREMVSDRWTLSVEAGQ